MIRTNKLWCKVPSEPVVAALTQLSCRRDVQRSAAPDTAALMIYMTLILMSDVKNEEMQVPVVNSLGSSTNQSTYTRTLQIAYADYDALQKATMISRASIRLGIARLVELDLIIPLGSDQKRRYLIRQNIRHSGWFKLPCASIVRDQIIIPFESFSLRAKHESHALRIYLYLAVCRKNSEDFTLISREKIFSEIGILEEDTCKAMALLVDSGLLLNVERACENAKQHHVAKKYYFAGGDTLEENEMPGTQYMNVL